MGTKRTKENKTSKEASQILKKVWALRVLEQEQDALAEKISNTRIWLTEHMEEGEVWDGLLRTRRVNYTLPSTKWVINKLGIPKYLEVSSPRIGAIRERYGEKWLDRYSVKKTFTEFVRWIKEGIDKEG
jgi:hypothetical protein